MPRLDDGQPGIAQPTQAFFYLFMFAHFKKAEGNMGLILEHGLRFLLGRDVERGCQSE